jgi:hypothetical protein
MRIIPINEAEAIIEPFWDAPLCELGEWIITPGTKHGFDIYQNWCWTTFVWARKPDSGPALFMRRECDIDCGNYDRLVLSVMAPEKAVVRMAANTDDGIRESYFPPAGKLKAELTLDISGTAKITSIIIEINAGVDGIAQGWFNWLGLQHSGRLAEKLNNKNIRDSRWEKHLKDESFTPEFKPLYGLVLNAEELEDLRTRHEKLIAAGNSSPFIIAAAAAKSIQPETLINEFVNFWGDTRYTRERDHGRQILNHGMNAAIAGYLLRDKELLRLAARYAMSIAMCDNWDDGFICRFPGSTFDHRCFVQSLCAYDVAGILDLAGEFFTDTGRDFLRRRLAEEAVGAINYNTWRYDYIFHCNQLAWFTPGRMLALGVLRQQTPRLQPYIDIAYDELRESLEYTILPDGGYVEGPTYFRCVGRDAGLGIYFYSRIMGKPMAECIPESMKRCGDFGEVFISTNDRVDVIPVCDASANHEITSQAIMAGLLPGSAWQRMLKKAIIRNGGWPSAASVNTVHSVPNMTDAAIAWGLASRGDDVEHEFSPFTVLPHMGPVVSQRQFNGEVVKLLIQGNQANAGHTHEDKGSFVLEFAGDTFAIDPGTCDYSNPLAGVLHNCERHNMLVPYGFDERPAPACPLPYDVKPTAIGDIRSFHAEIDASPGWDNYYRRWRRVWHSSAPDELTITDNYELANGDGVEFYWQTMLPVSINGSIAAITGKKSRVELHSPPNCIWSKEELPLIEGNQTRLAFRHAGKSGEITVRVKLLLNDLESKTHQ